MHFPVVSHAFLSAFTLLAVAACQQAPSTSEGTRQAVVTTADVTNENEVLFEAIDQAIETEMRENHIPGVAVVIVRDGQTIYKRGYGIANVETNEPVDPDRTIFRIGSTSKALTLLALTRLVDDERLSRNTDVSEYFTEIENERAFERPVTIDHLLSHTTGFDQPGFGRQLGGFEYSITERQAARPSLSDFLSQRNLRRINPPGELFRYDTYGPTLAGVILEQVTGLPFDQAMQQEMFAPLGMAHSSVEVRQEHEALLASGHGYVDGTYETTPYEIYMTTPASSIDATVADMGRLLEALTGDGSNAHGRLVSEEMQQTILQSLYRPRDGFAGMSHGLWESLSEGRGEGSVPIRTLGHGGDMWGFNGSMTLIPELDLAFYVVANRNGEGGGARVKIGRPVMQAILATLAPDRVAQPIALPPIDANANLSDYEGTYFWSVFCHTCTPAEFELGAWRRPSPIRIQVQSGTLMIDGRRFLPLGDDVFVDDSGFDQIFFKRDAMGDITSYSFKEDPTTYERG
jgi:CubicO group peptidase (beta-lactamase class C family)